MEETTELTLEHVNTAINDWYRQIASISNGGGSARMMMKFHLVKPDESISGISGWICPTYVVQEALVDKDPVITEFDFARLEDAISTFNRAVYSVNQANRQL